ncbi:VOC family protein [Amycolatopsis endophytica]|uniref:Catechol-2,3-dioxygenase n=1 Tax=Amycolatopsis endophytica TaxID=860233 RepID=A0A853AXC7_9PSEU|nr:VOC family protein [Amycolatopsis endophytica]NYI87289.1 catechol-2,3-dioxygenase [Amycolatopsis endophytica]
MSQERSPQPATAGASVSPDRLAHVVLRTTRYDDMVTWYRTVLGARTSFEAPGAMCFLTFDEEHHRVAIAGVPTLAERPVMAAGLEHIAFTYATLGDLVATYERLKKLDIEPYWTINHGPTISFYYRDPDNNQLELQVDNFATIEETNEFLTAEFPKNPIGVNLDADEFVRRFHDGVPETELRKRPETGTGGLDAVRTM